MRFIVFLGALVALLAISWTMLAGTPASAQDKMAFWDVPQPGTNSFNVEPPSRADMEATAASGVTWVRLTFSKWQGEGQDFLLGDADDYTGIPESDLATLIAVLDRAEAAGLKVVVTPLSLPGARWQQQNNGTFDDRLWSDPAFAPQAAAFWRDAALALKGHPAVAAYNIVNEPAPERTQDLDDNASIEAKRAFLDGTIGTPRNLPELYETIIAAIREVDPDTPIMVDAGHFANPGSLASWPAPLSDPRVLYAFHMYEPWVATSAPNLKRDTPLRYPGVVSAMGGEEVAWTADTVAEHMGLAYGWAKAQDLPPTRIVVSEFGCMRLWADCGAYLDDVLAVVVESGGHWAFYEFRADDWDGMDYQIPASFPSGRYYWFMEQGREKDVPRNGELFVLIRSAIAKTLARAAANP